MDEKKRNRQQLRRRLELAEYTIFRRNGWPHGTAHRMAREKVDAICAQIAREESQRKKESQQCLTPIATLTPNE